MPLINQIQKKIRMDRWDIVKFQLNIHCHLNKIILSDLDLCCLTLLALTGEIILGDFCKTAVESNVATSHQSVRNIVNKAEEKQLITKNGKNKKKITLNIQNIQTSGNILLEYKIVRVEPKEAL